MLDKNAFGRLIRAYREQRGWTQDELAERWGYTREYVSQIELGKRKLTGMAQVLRLAELLEIPMDRLEAIGRGIPKRWINAQRPEQTDDAILQMLLAPGREMVRLAYLVWVADQYPVIEEQLRGLISQLDEALMSYHGGLLKPAQQLLAYAHQMLGKIAFDRLDLTGAAGHFSEVVDLGEELQDSDLITLGLSLQASVLRKRGRFEHARHCFEAAQRYVANASPAVQGVHYQLFARLGYDSGDEQSFLRAIDQALEIASQTRESLTTLSNDFSLDEVLQEQASGYTELHKPERALEIFQQTDRLRSFRPLREQGAYLMIKAQAHLQAGDLDQGIALARRGLEIATQYQSRRQIGWLEKSYMRLRMLPLGKDRRLEDLRDAIAEAKRSP
ncbi:helix-turn-helix domain-containing protein [Thermogemmatispora tikiterensis]|uniref:HTH cro/C1-type domain-containing protein n=1 Tax=Thermogemmatispora tikiterensis TaxID=1825093 RepID=A0A328VHL2_9CHLR|nr:helix-turn-helix transcriptional regulator [Thermogemmatispora tikiterensis]RAQ94624.1 hypothetical protein A4R35_03695 [Thermogemmatispora tikiterensis]